MKRFYCTYFDKNYLIKGIAFIESLQRHEQSNYILFVICMDQFTYQYFSQKNYPNVRLIPFEDLEKMDSLLYRSKSTRNLVEYYWTCKSSIIYLLLKLFPEIDAILYFDADIFFYQSIDPVWEAFEGNSVLIHEHRFSQEQSALMMYGRFNAGFAGFRNDQKGMKALIWWREQSIEWCYARLENGRYADQLYLNQLPIQFQGVKILEHIGAGVGPWNHIQYRFTKDYHNQVWVNELPLVFYHFHSFTFVHPEIIIPSKYTINPFTMEILTHCFIPYANQLLKIIQNVRTIHPDFSFGLLNEKMINEQRMFIALKSVRHRIAQAKVPHQLIPIDTDWDCYASPQFRQTSMTNNTYTDTLPIPTGKKQTPPDLILDQAEHEVQKGNTFIAIQILMKLTEKWPDYYLAYNDLGIIYWKSGDKKKAFQYIKKAYELNPFDVKVVKNIGNILINIQEIKMARDIFSHYMERFPADLTIRDMLHKIVKPVMLNLGCGRTYHSDWINIDIQSSGPDVTAHNLFHGIPYADNSVDVVYHSHLLEHMPKQFGLTFIRDCFRVIKNGGIIRVAVPDLEQIAREYIKSLENALNDDEQAANRYEWIMLELYDQTVRNQPGGAMLDYWKQNPMPAESYVFQRCGNEAMNAVMSIRKSNITDSPSPDPMIAAMKQSNDQLLLQMARFRASGEVHQWMYDRYSLQLLLKQAGFSDIRVCKADQSNIADFQTYGLETDATGKIRKPDSLFMEARKF
jgi:predicted SAM-dependent methyltransferase